MWDDQGVIMTLTIELTPEQEARLRAEADASGMALPDFARLRLLAVPEVRPKAFRKFGTADEKAADEAEWAARFQATGDSLGRMAAEADEEYRLGLTVPRETLFGKC
jgi:hypothetical protein